MIHRVTATDYVRLDFDLGLGIAGGKFFIRGGTALEVTLPGSKTVGPVTAQSITLLDWFRTPNPRSRISDSIRWLI